MIDTRYMLYQSYYLHLLRYQSSSLSEAEQQQKYKMGGHQRQLAPAKRRGTSPMSILLQVCVFIFVFVIAIVWLHLRVRENLITAPVLVRDCNGGQFDSYFPTICPFHVTFCLSKFLLLQPLACPHRPFSVLFYFGPLENLTDKLAWLCPAL